MVEQSDSPCSSDHNEYPDPLQIAVSAQARLSSPEKANISWKRKVQTNPEEKKSNMCGSPKCILVG